MAANPTHAMTVAAVPSFMSVIVPVVGRPQPPGSCNSERRPDDVHVVTPPTGFCTERPSSGARAKGSTTGCDTGRASLALRQPRPEPGPGEPRAGPRRPLRLAAVGVAQAP